MITWGFRGTTAAELERYMQGMARIDARLNAATISAVTTVTAQLRVALGREFVAGRDSAGQSHNKTGATLSTLDSQVAGFIGRVTMDRGAVFVQYGSRAHIIRARTDFLVFQGRKGNWVRKKDVLHPGYKGDDFAGRAIATVMALDALAVAVGRVLTSFFGEAYDRFGTRYPTGE